MKEKHYKEFAKALKGFSPKHKSAEDAERAANQLQEVQKKLDSERKKREHELRKEQAEFEEEQRKRNQSDMVSFQASLDKDLANEKAKYKKNIELLEARKEELARDNKMKMQNDLEKLKSSGNSQQEQDELISKYQKELQSLMNKLEADKLRMQTNLEERLAKRRQEREKKNSSEMELEQRERKRELAEKQRSELNRLKADEALTLKECLNTDPLTVNPAAMNLNQPKIQHQEHQQATVQTPIAPVASTPQTARSASDMPQSFTMLPPLDEAELTAMLMASPLYQKLEKIKRQINQSGISRNKKKDGEAYIDHRDAGWTKDEKLIPLDLNKVDSRTFVVYKFGCFVVDLLSAHCQHPSVTLLLADKIPPNKHLEKNAYRNSFHYDAHNHILYMRADRTDCVGQFVLVLVHTMAHIKSGDLRDDTNSQFAEELYRALSVVCDDLFFSRYRTEGGLTGDKQSAKTMLTSLFGEAQTENEKANVIDGLIDTRILPSTDAKGISFNPEMIKERLSRYQDFATNSKLRSYLGDVEGKMDLAKYGAPKLVGDSVLTRRLLPDPSIISNLTGHALWQKFVNANAEEGSAGQPSTSNKQVLAQKVEDAQTTVDDLNASFATETSNLVALKEKLRETEEEIARQNKLSGEGKKVKKDEKAAVMAKMKEELSSTLLKLELMNEQIIQAEKELQEHQAALNSVKEVRFS